MASENGPDDARKSGPGPSFTQAERDGDLERRRLELDAQIATRRPAAGSQTEASKSSGAAGYGNAMKLSSEFIAGIVVGAGLGWMIDRWAGSSPWGLIVFLFLGFGAGVLNMLRAAGAVTEAGIRAPDKNGGTPPKT